MAMADGGELIVMAPGVNKFGEDPGIDSLIRQVSVVCVSWSTLHAYRLEHTDFPCVFTCCRQSQHATHLLNEYPFPMLTSLCSAKFFLISSINRVPLE